MPIHLNISNLGLLNFDSISGFLVPCLSQYCVLIQPIAGISIKPHIIYVSCVFPQAYGQNNKKFTSWWGRQNAMPLKFYTKLSEVAFSTDFVITAGQKYRVASYPVGLSTRISV